MDDIADTAKHGSLRKAERQVIVAVCSCFLCNESGQFKFLRNVPYISKKGMLEVDFMEASLNEIQFIKKKLGIDINTALAIKEYSSGFEDVAKLVFNSAYCINMSSVRLRFFKKSYSSKLIPYDPPEWKLEVH
ncbi:MAG: hypothetical protein P1U50_12455 [Parvibaculaceae bacterium]|nr:hypothetical protein [Parvibaculaceae bacterium]